MSTDIPENLVRQPIVVTVGHIDHGKTSLLDSLRGTAIQAGEHGGITQSIGASIIPLDTIRKMCGSLLDQLKIKLTIPGLLFIDTPGHEAFTSLRKRGGSLADIAILVVDINEGVLPQTKESINILKQYHTPFVVAANKVDLVPGWQEVEGALLAKIEGQQDNVKYDVEKKLYELVGQLKEQGFDADRFDRVKDYTKQIAVVPCSAKSKEGIAEVIMVLTGLTQRYLNENLHTSIGPGKGAILEIKETKGLGTTLDVILYEGIIRKDDTIVVGTLSEPIVSKIRVLLEPAPLEEMRDHKSQFISLNEVRAATGVRIAAPGLDKAASGMPIVVCLPDKVEEALEGVRSEVQSILIETGSKGIVIKADSVGSLEALQWMLNQSEILVRRATIGNITRKDIVEAQIALETDRKEGAILGFNVELDPQARIELERSGVKIFTNSIIYRLIEEYHTWIEEVSRALAKDALKGLVRPCKIRLLPGYVFRQSNPAVVGVEILAGELRTGTPLMKLSTTGERITTVRAIQHENKSISVADEGKRVAVSLDRVIVGRQIAEGDELFAAITDEIFRKLKEEKAQLSNKEIGVLKEIAKTMREENPTWGI